MEIDLFGRYSRRRRGSGPVQMATDGLGQRTPNQAQAEEAGKLLAPYFSDRRAATLEREIGELNRKVRGLRQRKVELQSEFDDFVRDNGL